MSDTAQTVEQQVTLDNPLNLDIQAIVRRAQDDLVGRAVASVENRVSYVLNRELESQVGAIVSKFIADEIAPALTERLYGRKSAIIEAAANEVPRLAQAVAEAVVNAMVANLGEKWQRDKVVKALMGIQ